MRGSLPSSSAHDAWTTFDVKFSDSYCNQDCWIVSRSTMLWSSRWLGLLPILVESKKAVCRPDGPDRLVWAHTPKTGSTFFLSLMSDCCPSYFERRAYDRSAIYYSRTKARVRGVPEACGSPSVGHGPMKKVQAEDGVILLREPKMRLASSFRHFMHSEGMSSNHHYRLTTRIANRTVEECGRGRADEICKAYAAAREYFAEDAVKGCVVKTLNGIWCSKEGIEVNEEMLESAKKKLARFYFVGVHEDWTASVFAFHYLRGSNVSAYELAELRRNKEKSPTEEELLARIPFEDPWDTALYDYGKNLFYERFGHMIDRFKDRAQHLQAQIAAYMRGANNESKTVAAQLISKHGSLLVAP